MLLFDEDLEMVFVVYLNLIAGVMVSYITCEIISRIMSDVCSAHLDRLNSTSILAVKVHNVNNMQNEQTTRIICKKNKKNVSIEPLPLHIVCRRV